MPEVKASKKNTKSGPEKEKTKTSKKKNEFGVSPEDIMKTGVHLGHTTSKFNPKMTPYIMGVKNKVHILDPQKIAEKLVEALKFIEKAVAENKKILLVGTRPPMKNLVRDIAEGCDIFYINERWLGGTFTNFETIQKRIKYFRELEEKKKKGELDKYTKKEQLEIDEEIKKLERRFRGIKNMEKLPDIVFIVDMKHNELAAREARKKGITIIGLCDTNIDPTLADYPIPGSDDAISSVKYILGKLQEVILKTKKK